MPEDFQAKITGSTESPGREKCFYIDVDVSGGWPYQASIPLCKFGVTNQTPKDRCKDHNQILRQRWGIDAELKVCFVATGRIVDSEEEIKDHTLAWLPEEFERSAEWRRCPPRQLARVALLIAEKNHRSAQGQEQGSRAGRPAADRRLAALGTQVWREPMPAANREWAIPKGRPLLEPRPEGGPSTEEPSLGFWAGEIPTGTGLSHRWLRQRNLFAEWRAVQDATPWAISQDDGLSLRLRPAQKELLEEALAHSSYQDVSAYLRAAGTGRDRFTPIVAKGGILFVWLYAYLGEEAGRETWDELGRLTRFLFDLESPSDALGLIRRHLQARLAAAETGPRGAVNEDDLPPVPNGAGASGRDDSRGTPPVSSSIYVKISGPRKRLIRENAGISAYGGMSEYVRRMALGWDRNSEIVDQCDLVARWISERLGEPIGQDQWEELAARLGVFLFGSTGERDPEGVLRRGTRHLLGISARQVAEETGFTLFGNFRTR